MDLQLYTILYCLYTDYSASMTYPPQMFGELYVDDLGSTNATVYFPGTRSQPRAAFVIVLAGLYLSIVGWFIC